MLIEKHLRMLGMKCRDKVTGLEGVVTSMSFDLYGCIQAIVHPGLRDGVLQETRWFDVARLEITSDLPVMDCPDFEFGAVAEGKKGPSEKPMDMKA